MERYYHAKSELVVDLANLLKSIFCRGRQILVHDKVYELRPKLPKYKMLKPLRTQKLTPGNGYIFLVEGLVKKDEALLESIFQIACQPAADDSRETYVAEIHFSFGSHYPDFSTWIYHRISLYQVDAASRHCVLAARYEKGRELIEGDLKPGEELLNVDNYSSVYDYMRDEEAEGGGGLNSLTGPAADHIDRIMEKYHVTLRRAYEMREAGVTVPYQAPEDEIHVEAEERPKSEYTSSKFVRCNFFTLVIRNEALEKKYKGGLRAFINKYVANYNDGITVMVAMAAYDLDEPCNELKENRLSYKEDFILFEPLTAGISRIFELRLLKQSISYPHLKCTPCSWLKVYDTGRSIVACYVDSKC